MKTWSLEAASKGAPAGPMEFVELLTFRNEHEAKLAGSRLRAAGIPSSLAKDDACGMEPHLQLSRSVRLRVPRDRVKDARRLLGIGES